MSAVCPISGPSNLPPEQRFTQRLADDFNADERLWERLLSLRRLRRLLCPGISRRKRKAQDLADFARVQPLKNCVAHWKTDSRT